MRRKLALTAVTGAIFFSNALPAQAGWDSARHPEPPKVAITPDAGGIAGTITIPGTQNHHQPNPTTPQPHTQPKQPHTPTTPPPTRHRYPDGSEWRPYYPPTRGDHNDTTTDTPETTTTPNTPNPTEINHLITTGTIYIPITPPQPTVGPNPHHNEFKATAVGFPLWLHTPPQHPIQATTTIRHHTLTLTATPGPVTFTTGEGTTLTCTHTHPYPPNTKPGTPSPTCGYRYQHPGNHTLTATQTWNITWHTTTTHGTTQLTRTATTTIPVIELTTTITN